MRIKNHLSKWLIGLSLLCALSLAACTGEADGTVTETDTETETVTTADETETTADSESESESETETETTDYSAYTADYGYSLLYSTTATGSATQITNRKTAGARIQVAADCFLTGMTICAPSWGDNEGSMDFVIYRWDTDYATTTKAEPAYTYTVTNVVDNQWLNIPVTAQTVGEGEWLYEFRNGSENAIGVVSIAGTPEESGEHIRFVEGYTNGRATKRAVQSYATYVRYEKGAEEPKPIDPKDYTRLTEGKAHVIVLTGQSNAAGQSLSGLLKDHISAEDLAMYEKGFDNILIDVHADNANVAQCVQTKGFVPVKLGQGSTAERFGIEVGLAAYLTKTYPGETFYIIKSGFSASGLAKHWQDGQFSHSVFIGNMEKSLKRLTDMGLEPEIFAFLWMQGETDACSMEDTVQYADLQDNLIARMSERYADYIAPGGFAFIDAAISEKASWPYAAIVNLYKQKCDALSQNRYFLDTNTPDIDCRDENNDLAHYDSDDMLELGTLFGEAVGQVIENAKKAAS